MGFTEADPQEASGLDYNFLSQTFISFMGFTEPDPREASALDDHCFSVIFRSCMGFTETKHQFQTLETLNPKTLDSNGPEP
jgi:hypothetical protein